MRNTLRTVGAGLIAGLMLTAAIAPSFAQVIPSGATTQRRPSPRQLTDQTAPFIRTTLTNAMCGLTAVGTCVAQAATASLPYNAVVLRVYVAVYTAFNSTTSDTLTVGTTSANANEIVSTTVNLQTAGLATATVLPASINSLGNTATQTGTNGGFDIWIKWTSAGATLATAGLASLIIEYAQPNDGTCVPNTSAGAKPAGC